MLTTILLLTLRFARFATGQWNNNAGANNFPGTGASLNGKSAPFNFFAPSNNGLLNDPRSPVSSTRSGDNWNWMNGQNVGSNFPTSGGGFQPASSFNSIATPYYGSRIGSLNPYQHGVHGQVFAVDDETILVKGFAYDGQVQDAHFYIGKSETPSPFQGMVLASAQDGDAPIGRSDGQDIVLKLRSGGNLRAHRWLAVMSNSQNSNFGDVIFPRDLSSPKAVSLGQMMMPATGYLPQNSVRSGPVTVVNDKQIQIMNFYYDGKAPDAYFWIGQGPQPSSQGTIVPVESSYAKLPVINGQTITLTLPGNYNIQNINWLAVWSRMLNVALAHVMIPNGLNVPPALAGTPQTFASADDLMDLSNCEVFGDGRLQVRWALAGQDLTIQLKGNVDEREYMAFGLSGTQNQVAMIGSDVVVAFWDPSSNSIMAEDYTLSSRQECNGRNGVCPDTRLGGSNNIETLSGSRVDGYTTITYRRIINTGDRLDQVLNPNSDTYIVWAIGPLNQEGLPAKHEMRASVQVGERLRFGRTAVDNCPSVQNNLKSFSPSGFFTPSVTYGNLDEVWRKQYIFGNETRTFIAVIGPGGGRKGFQAATQKQNLGLVWYLNGKMAPELVLRRGDTYQFIVYGGMYPQAQPRYHPLYITTDASGGFDAKFPAEKAQEEPGLVAGVNRLPSGQYEPAAMGQYCAFVPSGAADPDSFTSFEEYNRTLTLQCDGSPPGVLPVGAGVFGLLEWTPSMEAPDTLYYQCYSHRDMGWKITLVNSYEGQNTPEYRNRQQLQPASGLSARSQSSGFYDREEISGSSQISGFTATILSVFVAFLLNGH